MRKSELVVDAEYAVGPPLTGYGAFRCARARVIAIDGAALGVLVRFLDAGKVDYATVKAGQTMRLATGRDIRMPWARYAELLAQHEAAREATREREAREQTIGRAAELRLEEMGFDVSSYSRGVAWDVHKRVFRVSPEEMTELIRLVPRGAKRAA